MHKTSPKKLFSCFVLLSALFLLEPVGAGPVLTTVSNRSFLSNETSNGAVNADINRMQTWSAKDDESDKSEERVDIKVPGTEKLKGLITSGTTKLEKLASRVKNRLAFNNQKGAEDSVANLGVGAAAESKRIESTLVHSVTNTNNQKATEDGISKLGVGVMESKRTDTALAQSVTTINNKKPELNEEAFLTVLTAQYGDDALTKLLVDAQHPGASHVARTVKAIQFDNWVTQKKTAGDIYNLLKLNVEDADFLVHPLLPTWISFVKTKLKEDPFDFLLLKLSKHYKENVLAKLLLSASSDTRVGGIAKRLENAQLKNWLAAGKTKDDVLKLLHLNPDEGLEFLKQPAMKTFISYATTHRREDPYKFLGLKLLKSHGEEKLAKMLVTAKSDPRLRIIAGEIENAQFKIWLGKGNTSNDVLKILHLNPDKGYEMLKNPSMQVWFWYVTYSRQNPAKLLYQKLNLRFGDEEILKMYFASSTDGSVKVYLTGMDDVIKHHWLEESRKAEAVFTDLTLHKDSKTIFQNPLLLTWSSYLTKIHGGEADNVMLEVMTKYYGNGALKEMIDQAKHSTIPRTFKGTAQRLETQIWLREGKIAGDGFKLFDPHERGDAIFENPAFLNWVSYFNKFHNSEKSQDEFAIISELAKRFDDELDLARALSDARNNPALRGNTEEAIVTLQKLKFKQWMRKKDWNPKELRYALVRHNADPRYLGVRLGFDTFYKATRGSMWKVERKA